MENEKLVIDSLTILANKLGTTGIHLWGVLVRQAPISSITSLSFFTIGFLIAITGWICVFKIDTLLDNPNVNKEAYTTIAVMISIVSFIISIIVLFNVDSVNIWIAGLCNPEYWALQTLLHALK